MPSPRISALLIATLVATAAPSLARGQDATSPTGSGPYAPPEPTRSTPPEPSPLEHRTGWFAGLNLGMGSISYTSSFESEGAFGLFLDAWFGGMISSRFGLSVGFSSDGNNLESGEAATQNTWMLEGTYWFHDRIWIKVGFGAATLKLQDPFFDESFDGASLLSGIGFEFLHHGHYAFDLSMRVTSTGYGSDNLDGLRRMGVAFNVGVARY